MMSTNHSCFVVVLLALHLTGPAVLAQVSGGAEHPVLSCPPPARVVAAAPTLERPYRLPVAPVVRLDPLWTDSALWGKAPTRLSGLADAPKAGPAVYDPSSRAWYASAAGSLVRVEPDGGLRVLVQNVQGRDLDVRAGAGVAVSREPNHTIVLHRWTGQRGHTHRTTLLSGARFFHPRLSPDGRQVLVAESRPDGGHMWLLDLKGGAKDLGHGYGATWHPDGRRIVFARVVHDRWRITASELWVLDLRRGVSTQLTRTGTVAEVEPSVSLDGRWIAYGDALTSELCVARLR